MATLVNCFAIQGIDGYPVDIEIKTLEGQPAISIIGLGDLAVKEAAERIQAAIDESGFVFPKKVKVSGTLTFFCQLFLCICLL